MKSSPSHLLGGTLSKPSTPRLSEMWKLGGIQRISFSFISCGKGWGVVFPGSEALRTSDVVSLSWCCSINSFVYPGLYLPQSPTTFPNPFANRSWAWQPESSPHVYIFHASPSFIKGLATRKFATTCVYIFPNPQQVMGLATRKFAICLHPTCVYIFHHGLGNPKVRQYMRLHLSSGLGNPKVRHCLPFLAPGSASPFLP